MYFYLAKVLNGYLKTFQPLRACNECQMFLMVTVSLNDICFKSLLKEKQNRF